MHSGMKIITFGMMGLFLVAFGISIDPPMGYHPIANIVKGGNVFLEGVLDNEGHKNMAILKALWGIRSVLRNQQPAGAEPPAGEEVTRKGRDFYNQPGPFKEAYFYV